MPIYQYQCQKCNAIFEKLLTKPSNKIMKCPKCDANSQKIPARMTFVLGDGGVGWAKDGYSKK